MWETISSIFINYWVEFLLGLIVAGGGFFIRRYMKLSKKERQEEQKQFFDGFIKEREKETKELIDSLGKKYEDVNKVVEERYVEITNKLNNAIETLREERDTEDEKIKESVDSNIVETKALKAGILSMQGKEFKQNCRKLLAEDHEITLEEWEEIESDHHAYNGLGGNHKGDELFAMVKKKFENSL